MHLKAVLVGVIVGLTFVSQAGAAYVRVVPRDTWVYGAAEPITVYDLVYDGEASEHNRLVVTADPTRTSVVFTDAGVKMRTDPLRTPTIDGNSVPRATWQCATPGSSVAACVATPGSECHSLMCGAAGPKTFTGVLRAHGNNGNDRIAILSSKLNGRARGGDGNDTIAVANNSSDTVDCGSGTDTVVADAGDAVAANCESVTRR